MLRLGSSLRVILAGLIGSRRQMSQCPMLKRGALPCPPASARPIIDMVFTYKPTETVHLCNCQRQVDEPPGRPPGRSRFLFCVFFLVSEDLQNMKQRWHRGLDLGLPGVWRLSVLGWVGLGGRQFFQNPRNPQTRRKRGREM